MGSEFPNARPIPLSEIRDAVDVEILGGLDERTEFRWIERDSRAVEPGDLFIAIAGERFDGHRFIESAAKRGARAALVARRWWDANGRDTKLPLLIVDEPLVALQQLAAARRSRLQATAIGVTGSLGKTSTKESIAAGLGSRKRVYKSPGNMNSEIGLPLSLLEVPEETEVAVLEMGGAYALGEVALLATIARPRIGVVTNVHPIHLERMGSIEAIAETKTELVESLPGDGVAILNAGNRWVADMAGRTTARVLTYGVDVPASVIASNVQTRGLDGIVFQLDGEAGSRRVELPMMGGHAVELALAAICAGLATEVSLDDVLSGLSGSGVQVRLVPLPGPRNSRLIDDTYNASAPSVISALRTLAEIPAERRIAVLGEMRELGEETRAQHQAVGRVVAETVDVLLTFGETARIIAETALAHPVDGRKVDVTSFQLDQRDALTRVLLEELRPGDVALLKGSRGLEMETIVASLQDAAAGSHADE